MWMKTLSFVSISLMVFSPSWQTLSAADSGKLHTIKKIEYKCGGDSAKINTELVKARVQLKEGGEFSPFLADSSIKEIYASGKFEHASVRVDEMPGENGYKVTFLLTPRVVMNSISFSGNANYKAKALNKQIETRSGYGLSTSSLISDAVALTKFYNDKGYPYARVSHRVVTKPDSDEVDVVFDIEEGPKFRVGKIKFPGNDAVKNSVLLKAMRTKRWTLLSIFKKSGVYRPDDFSADIDALKAVFKDYGYLDIEINESDVEFVRRGKTLSISIPVKPGNRYYVGNVSISGNNLYDDEQLENELTVCDGDVFSPAEISASCEKLVDFYGKFGYINTSVRVEKKPNLSTGKIDLEFTIEESDKCFVGEIEVRGNSKTKNKVILRELTLAPGDPFDIVRMKNSRARLLNTGFFSFVDISPIDTKVPAKKNIRIDVSEMNTGKAGFGGAISTGGEIVGILEFSQRNFDVNSKNRILQGGGQKFRSRLQMGKHSTSIDVNFEEPWWYDREIAIGANLFVHKTSYDKKLRDYSGANYSESRIGGETYIRKRIYKLWESKLTYGLEDVKIHDIARRAPACFFEREGHSLISRISLAIERDSRNNFVYPTAGSKISLETEFAGGPLGGKVKFFKIDTYASKHWLISETAEQVFSLIGMGGAIVPYGGGTTPFFERFHLGGANLMKGFKAHDIGPKDGGTGTGGDTFYYGAAEYCFKLANPLRFYLFAEIGVVNEKKWNFSTRRYATDAGFGLKISILGMPLRLDFGFPIRGHDGNKHGMRFNYSFGLSF
jgi:outer membrane protein insertion porin family